MLTHETRPDVLDFYRRSAETLRDAEVPYLVGGAYAMRAYTGIERDTHDFDVFVRPVHAEAALAALAAAGYKTELTFPHWLGKAYLADDYVDVIFSSGNGVVVVDDQWFARAVPAEILGVPVELVPAEEIVWSKAFIMERERFDGADVAHLLRARAADLDWPRLLARFGPRWRVLFAHLVLFGFVYPGERRRIPAGVMRELQRRLEHEVLEPAPDERFCNGTLLSREQYLADVEQWGYHDARSLAEVSMTPDDVASWTEAIKTK